MGEETYEFKILCFVTVRAENEQAAREKLLAATIHLDSPEAIIAVNKVKSTEEEA